jgi:hypothetical protein
MQNIVKQPKVYCCNFLIVEAVNYRSQTFLCHFNIIVGGGGIKYPIIELV